jgi:MFS family permease
LDPLPGGVGVGLNKLYSVYSKKLIFWSACMGMLLFGIAMITLGSVAPDISMKLGLDAVSAGTLFSILPIGIMAGSLLFGPVADRNGYRILLAVSCIILFAGFEGVAFSRSIGPLRLFVLLIGVGGGAVNGATNAVISDISEIKKGANLSLLGVFFGIGALGMPLITGLLRNIVGYETIIAGVGALSLLAGLTFLTIKFPPPKQEKSPSLFHNLKLLKDGTLLLISFFLFFQSSFEAIINNWTTSYIIDKLNVHPDRALFALSSFVAGMTLMRIVTGGFMRSVPEKTIFSGCFALLLSGLVLLIAVPSYKVSVAALFIMGAGLSYGFPAMLGFIGNRFADLSGTTFSIALVIALIGNMSVNYATGYIAKYFGIGYLTTVAFVEILGMMLLAIMIFRKLNKNPLPYLYSPTGKE